MLTMWFVSGNGISGPAIVWSIHLIKRTSPPLAKLKGGDHILITSPQPSGAVYRIVLYTSFYLFVAESKP